MKRPNLYDRLKVAAILTMIVDHIGYTFFPEISWLRLIGRIAFPIFLFLVGFNGNYKRKRNLFWRAIAVQIPMFVLSFGFEFGSGTLNILFGIILARIVLQGVESRRSKVQSLRSEDHLIGLYRLLTLGLATVILLVIHPRLAEVWDYGSFVILFPIAGWMFAGGRDVLSKRLYRLLYGIVCFASLGFFSWQVFGFDIVQLCILGGFYVLLLCIFFVLGQENHFLPVGKKMNVRILFFSKNALLIYVFHLLALGVIKIFLVRR